MKRAENESKRTLADEFVNGIIHVRAANVIVSHIFAGNYLDRRQSQRPDTNYRVDH